MKGILKQISYVSIALLMTLSMITTPAFAGVSAGSITRTLSSNSVILGASITVTLTPNPALPTSPGWGVTETLPAGFIFVSTTADSHSDLGGNQYRFSKLGPGSITYIITSPSTKGTYVINGTFVDANKNTGILSSTTVNVIISIFDSYKNPVTGKIDKQGAINALNDYLFNNLISKEDAIIILNLYLFGE